MTEAATAPASGQAKQEEEKIQRNPGARPGTNKLKKIKHKKKSSVFSDLCVSSGFKKCHNSCLFFFWKNIAPCWGRGFGVQVELLSGSSGCFLLLQHGPHGRGHHRWGHGRGERSQRVLCVLTGHINALEKPLACRDTERRRCESGLCQIVVV